MLLLPIEREQFLPLLPKKAVVAEIGVAEGQFSKLIHLVTKPRRLHLIDSWKHAGNEKSGEEGDPFIPADNEQEYRYQRVKKRFELQTSEGTVAIHREYSDKASERFDNQYFDWIYIDGLHTYNGVMRDLKHYDKKVKSDGFILGHDYTNHEIARNLNFGVVEAVNDFIQEKGYTFLALMGSAYPMFVLAKNAEGQAAKTLVNDIIDRVVYVTEIKGFPGAGFEHRLIEMADKTYRAIASFGP